MADNPYQYHYPSDNIIAWEMERRNRLIGIMRETLGIPWQSDLETLEDVFKARVKELLGPSNELKELREKLNFIKMFCNATRVPPAPAIYVPPVPQGVPVTPKPGFLVVSPSPEPTDTSR